MDDIDLSFVPEWVHPFVEHHQKNMLNYTEHPVLIKVCPGPHSQALAALRICQALTMALTAAKRVQQAYLGHTVAADMLTTTISNHASTNEQVDAAVVVDSKASLELTLQMIALGKDLQDIDKMGEIDG